MERASVEVNVTVAEAVAPNKSLNPSKSLLQVTPLQASDATAPPLLVSHAFSAGVLPSPSRRNGQIGKSESMPGFVMSSMVNVAVVVL